jgi:hypothetical protein
VLRVETAEIRRSKLRLLDGDDEANLLLDSCARRLESAKEEVQAAEAAFAFLKGDGDLLELDLEDGSPPGKAFDSLADEHLHEIPQEMPASEIQRAMLSRGDGSQKGSAKP